MIGQRYSDVYMLLAVYTSYKSYLLSVTGANGKRSKPTSAVDHLRNVHIAIVTEDTDLVCIAHCCNLKQ